MFGMNFVGCWPDNVKSEILSWSGARASEDGQSVLFRSADYKQVEQELQQFGRQGAQLELLPSWVRQVVGFGRLDADPLLGLARTDAEHQIRTYIDSLPEDVLKERPILPYQAEGMSFGLHRGGRVLLGDEMGLGKTVQALIVAAQFLSEWPLLIIVPSSLRYVWRDQAIQWLPHIVGTDGAAVHVLRNGKDRAPCSARVIVGTYDLVRRCEQLQVRPDGRHFSCRDCG
jgi:hypothetical protein